MSETISIFKNFTAEERMTRAGGEKLRVLILESIQNGKMIQLDFEKKPIASVSFWDEGISKLLEHGLSRDDIDKKIKFNNIHPRDFEIMKELVDARAAEQGAGVTKKK